MSDFAALLPAVLGPRNVFQGRILLVGSPATTLYLVPYGGNRISWLGNELVIPAGFNTTISNAGLVASTLYYVYVRNNNGAPALELSTTGHSTDPSGVEVKTGDNTRLLAGMIFTDPSTPGQFLQDSSHQLVLNWYNRRPLQVAGAGGTATTASVQPAWSAGLAATSSNVFQILTWGAQLNTVDSITWGISGVASVNGAGGRGDVIFGTVAGGTGAPVSSVLSVTSAASGNVEDISCSSSFGPPAEGLVTFEMWGRAYGGFTLSIFVNSFGSAYG